MISYTIASPIPASQASSCSAQKITPDIEARAIKCESHINIGLFFDGTGNNLYKDEPKNAHSNVARLYRAYIHDEKSERYSVYIPGVGTPFPEIDEEKNTLQTITGNGLGWGGDSRILFALIQVFNAVHRSFGNSARQLKIDTPLFDREITKVICKDGDLTIEQRRAYQASNWHINRSTFESRLLTIRAHLGYMAELLRHPKTLPKPVEVLIDVFGFSRGAAEARVFTNKLFAMCDDNKLFGLPMQLRFLGLFDTVASVNLPNTVGADGHYGWSQPKDLTIDPRVKNWRHFVGLLEARASFPLDSARVGNNYPRNGAEIVYPGAHSDIGGGYCPGEQGRGMRFERGQWIPDDSYKFSQIPLNDMYNAAEAANVPWLRFDSAIGKERKLAQLFHAAPSLRTDMENYLTHCGIDRNLPVEVACRQHQFLYLTWRYHERERFEHLPGTRRSPDTAAGFSGRQDLLAGNRMLLAQIDKIEGQTRPAILKLQQLLKSTTAFVSLEAFLILWEKMLDAPSAKELLANLKNQRIALPSQVRYFFDEHLHDSYAGFKLIDALGTLEAQGYLHRRVVYAGDAKVMTAQNASHLPGNAQRSSFA